VDEVLDVVGLADRARDRVGGYSLGMKQRLAIGAALLSDPQLLLLDEPANGLDPAGIVGMRDTLRRLAAVGKTVFVSSHILGEVQQLAEIVGIIARGRLISEGPIASLLAIGGSIRIQVAPGDAARASAVLDGVAGPGASGTVPSEDGWLSVRFDPDRAAELNRALAMAGIYASRIELRSDLESVFLELTAAPEDDTGGLGGVQ
jgi:ABC-2 type transport system ATP-binding protein